MLIKQMSVCIVSRPPAVISLLLKQLTVLQSPIQLWFSMNNHLTVTSPSGVMWQ